MISPVPLRKTVTQVCKLPAAVPSVLGSTPF